MNMGPLQSLNTPSPGSDPTYVSTKYEGGNAARRCTRRHSQPLSVSHLCISPGHSMDTALWIGAAAALVTAITAFYTTMLFQMLNLTH